MIDNTQISNFKEYIFFIVGVLSMATYKFLSWIMPKTAEIFWQGIKQKIKEFQEANQTSIQIKMMQEISEIRKDLKKYKDKDKDKEQYIEEELKKYKDKEQYIEQELKKYKYEKHDIKGQLECAKEAIISNDAEALKVIREIYLKQIK